MAEAESCSTSIPSVRKRIDHHSGILAVERPGQNARPVGHRRDDERPVRQTLRAGNPHDRLRRRTIPGFDRSFPQDIAVILLMPFESTAPGPIETGSRCDARLPGFAQKNVQLATQLRFRHPNDQEPLLPARWLPKAR